MRVNGDAAYADEAEKTFGFVPQWAAGPDTPNVAQSALTVPPQVRAFLIDYMKTCQSSNRAQARLRRALACAITAAPASAR